jgi:NADPH2:quinone reductase
MKALRFSEFGPPTVLRVVDLPIPLIDAEHALIRVVAASVNPSDVKNVEGHMEGTVLPRVPGRDFSGVVEAGPSEWLGREVWGSVGDVGFSVDGTHAEFVALPIAALAPKPMTVSHEQTAALGITFLIAWLGLIEYARVQPHETVCVIGAGGGVGGAVVQIAKSQGCTVIGVDQHPPDAATPAARRLDAFVASSADVADEVRRLTGGRGADVVYDAVGGVMFEPAVRSLAHRGRLVEISATGRRRVEFDLVDFYHAEGRIYGADSRKLGATGAQRLLVHMTPYFEDGRFEPPIIAATFGLDHGVQAYTAVEHGTSGRVVLIP